jgi:hypothetical protein
MGTRFALVGCLAVTSLAGCLVPLARPPATAAVEPGQRAALTSKAVEVLQRRGYVLSLLDRTEGVVVSSRGAPCRDAVQVTLAADGRVLVTVLRQLEYGHNSCLDKSSAGEAAKVASEQEAILGEILGRAPPAAPAPARPAAGADLCAAPGLSEARLPAQAALLASPASSAQAVTVLPAGTRLCMTDWREGAFRQVRLEGNRQGWLPETALEAVGNASARE